MENYYHTARANMETNARRLSTPKLQITPEAAGESSMKSLMPTM